MNNNPKVSILIPCFNHDKFIEETIISVLNQTYNNLELLVVNDGSTDSSHEILVTLSSKFSFYYEYQDNKGISYTLNKLISISTGKYISFLASDDILEKNKISILVNEIEALDNSYCLVCGDSICVDENSNIINFFNSKYSTFLSYFNSKRSDDIFKSFGSYESLVNGNYIPSNGLLIRKKALINVGCFNENIKVEDWYLWLQLARKYKFFYVDVIVARYRIHSNNTSIGKGKKKNMFIQFTEILLCEKDYCSSRGLKSEWEQAFSHKLNYFLRSGHFFIFFKYISRISFLSYIRSTWKMIFREKS